MATKSKRIDVLITVLKITHPLEEPGSYDAAKKAADEAAHVPGATVEVVSQKLDRVAPEPKTGTRKVEE